MQVIDVKSRERRLVARFKENPVTLLPYEYCLVDCENDLELAKVKTDPYEWQDELPPETEAFVVRKAEKNDLDTYRRNREIEKEAFRFALNKVRERELPMSLASTERSFDGKKMRFYFTADNRIDFRDLVKDLAFMYKTRIEMRQIGVRDRAKKIGGYGICGQELCCSRFLQKFEPITIRMAKDQNLALNPTKISGLCGRLMCCLSYEVNAYMEAGKEFPPQGTRVETPEGKGVLSDYNYVRNTVTVRLDETKTMQFRLDQLKVLTD